MKQKSKTCFVLTHDEFKQMTDKINEMVKEANQNNADLSAFKEKIANIKARAMAAKTSE